MPMLSWVESVSNIGTHSLAEYIYKDGDVRFVDFYFIDIYHIFK